MWFSWRPKKSIALVESRDGIRWSSPVIVLGPDDRADWEALSSGELDGMTAFMMGKLKVEGDMSNAMQLQGVLTKLKS